MDPTDFLTPYQKSILSEVYAKPNGSINIPMGGGKTCIALTMCLEMRQRSVQAGQEMRPAIIVVSKSLISEWVHELKKFFPTVPYHILHKDYDKEHLTRSDVDSFPIILTTPETASLHMKHYNLERQIAVAETRSDRGTIITYVPHQQPLGCRQRTVMIYNPDEMLEQELIEISPHYGPLFTTHFSTLVIDEGSNYLNPRTRRTRALIGIVADRRWILSATLLSEPKPLNLFGYTLLINQQYVARDFPAFLRQVGSGDFSGISETVVRRTKNDDYNPESMGQVINHQLVTNTFTKAEARFFGDMKNIILAMNKIIHDLQRQNIGNRQVRIARGALLGMITHLRVSLTCPMIAITSMYLNLLDFTSSRNDISASFSNDIIKRHAAMLQDESSIFSSRLRAVVSLIEEHPDERIIVFSSFRTTLDVLAHFIPKERPIFTIRGSYSIEQRAESVRSWSDSSDGGAIMLLTYQTGSCGLNLQKGTVGIVMDFGWDMDVTQQAVGRIVRRGQTAEKISIYYLTGNTGLEKEIYKLHTAKKQTQQKIQSNRLEGIRDLKQSPIRLDEMIKFIDMKDSLQVLDDMYTSTKTIKTNI